MPHSMATPFGCHFIPSTSVLYFQLWPPPVRPTHFIAMKDSDKGSLLLFAFIVVLVILAVLVFGTDIFSPDNHRKLPHLHDAGGHRQASTTCWIV